MKNILFKALPLLAVVLFATSCNKDDGNDNIPTTPDNTVVSPDNAATTPDNTTTESIDLSQVVYDENGVPSIPFTITVGQDTESLSKAGITDELKQEFDEHDKLRITGENITGELSYVKESEWHRSKSGEFTGWLSGEGVTSLTSTTMLKAELYNDDYDNKGEPLSVPKEYKLTELDKAFRECGYLTADFTYQYVSGQSSTFVHLVQNTTFLKVTLEFSAKLRVETTSGDKYTFDIPSTRPYGTIMDGSSATRIIAVPNGATVSGDFMTARTVTAPTNGVCIHKITRTRPSEHCSYGAFSISETQQVLFANSNLRYGKSMGEWQTFSEKPWEVFFTESTDVGENHTGLAGGYIDLFGWGTWRYLWENPLKTAYNPLEQDDYTIWGTNYAHAPAAWDYDQVNKTGWYVLTKGEWDYILNQRVMPITSDGTRAPRFIRASIQDGDNQIPGLLIFPDDFNKSTSDMQELAINAPSYTGQNANFSENIFSSNMVKLDCDNSVNDGILTEYGAVFLPCAGSRQGTNATPSTTQGYYWTSTGKETDSECNTEWARYLNFTNSSSNYINFPENPQTYGYAVRLVHDLK